MVKAFKHHKTEVLKGFDRESDNSSTKLYLDELYLIAKAIDADPREMLNRLYGHLMIHEE